MVQIQCSFRMVLAKYVLQELRARQQASIAFQKRVSELDRIFQADKLRKLHRDEVDEASDEAQQGHKKNKNSKSISQM